LIATLALTFVCLFWGATFLWMKEGTEALQILHGYDRPAAIGAFFLFWRFLLATVLMPVFVPRSIKRLDHAAWKWGFLLSLPFTAGFLLQIFGLTQQDLQPSQSAFLTSLYVVTTPILAALIYRRLPAQGVLVGVVLATIGAAYIQGPPEGGLTIGAWATLGCAVTFGGHILLTDYGTKRADPLAITFVMFLFATLFTGAATLVAPGGLGLLEPDALTATLTDFEFWRTLVLCSTLASVLAISVLNRWQKELAPSRAAVVYTSEPVFASLISVIAGRDTVTVWLLFGATMILLANLSAEFIGRRKRPVVVLE
jgi:drug/metabolite transporter (DMT)-like permease